ncbi:helix-turn-helix transcriptional regulator [Nonomuraea sp. K274]|uniref:Helix-turn-helix transcriptional regulator n=1 Tax=Nonomuraea cypriaca TaxID=1187855 RepID=A0A931A905_9ACTN|nr:helix-turn-helix transcriptional regulator [Nonomuraea cypriaca]
MAERRDRLRALGELLRRLRKDAGLTGKDLAERAQVAQPSISRIETGQLLPTPETVEELDGCGQDPALPHRTGLLTCDHVSRCQCTYCCP